jgi:hypothetical protein
LFFFQQIFDSIKILSEKASEIKQDAEVKAEELAQDTQGRFLFFCCLDFLLY